MKWLGRPALRRDPIILILAIGAVWTTVMAANGATAVAPIAGRLWLTVLSPLAALPGIPYQGAARPPMRVTHPQQQ